MMKRIFTLIILFTGLQVASAQMLVPFTPKYESVHRGGIVMLSNSSVTCDGSDTACGGIQIELPLLGVGINNNVISSYIDIDLDPSTQMSSSDSLALPACSEIEWAGLFWGAEISLLSPDYPLRGQVKLKVGDEAYVNVNASVLEDNFTGFNTYHCYSDITAIVQAHGLNGRYTIADLATHVGGNDHFGGWTIVVAFKNDLLPLRHLCVYDGLCYSNPNDTILDVNINGFVTPSAGAVGLEIGAMVFDGDRALLGDQLLCNGNGSFVNVSDSVNPLNDIFNSTISVNGALSLFRQPNYNNTLGLDADIFLLDNSLNAYIGNSDTSLTLRLRAVNDSYLCQMFTCAVDVSEPDVHAILKAQDLNGGQVSPGDTIQYTVTVKNTGTDASVNTWMVDSLPYNALYINGSMQILSGPNMGVKTDVAGDDQAEYDAVNHRIMLRLGTGANATTGGMMNASATGNDSTRFTFKTRVISDCVALNCNPSLNNEVVVAGEGDSTGHSFTIYSSSGMLDSTGCAVAGPTALNIYVTGCSMPSDTSIAACNGAPVYIAYPLPGYAYYDSGFNQVTNTDTTGTYYAIRSPFTGCADTVIIQVTSLINCDHDNDSIPDHLDMDNDNDGIPDTTEIIIGSNGPDTDGDGQPNNYDLDSDNDGIPDVVEAGGNDANGDGEVDGFVDLNNNGLDDNLENNPLPGGNDDGDPYWNGVDLDSDNDGITDVIEAGGSDPDANGMIGTGSGNSVPDGDNDGLADAVDTDNGGTPLPVTNTDNHGRPDYRDLDSDNDGIVDMIEGQATAAFLAASVADSDNDGIMDPFDSMSGFGGSGIIPVNTDNADNPDYRDTDSDNDADSDALEAWDTDNNGTADASFSGSDLDNDGLDDAYDTNDALWDPDNSQTPASFPNLDSPFTPERDWREAGSVQSPDTDGDGVADDLDLDDDNDGLPDSVELATALNNGDTDNDGIPDILDLNSDNDMLRDVIEAGGFDPDNDGVIGVGQITDTDGDGLSDIVDADNGGTPLPNPDTDNDQLPNFQDVDSDGDGITDANEMDPLNTGNPPTDTDNDGIPDYLDNDDDNDGIATMNETDENGDGILDDCDLDQVPDYLDPDACGLVIPQGFSPNGDGLNDAFVINGLSVYPNAKLTVFNRWGNLVYKSDSYSNDWQGYATEGETLGNTLVPIGTYFYVLDLKNGDDPLSGYVYINR